MSSTHTVRQGEHITRIARKYGFFDYRTIWDHPGNAALKHKRPSPNVLLPGDSIFIPDKRQKTESRPSGDRHRFQVAGRKLKLRLVLRDYDNQPIRNAPCVLTVEGEERRLKTNADGLIEAFIPAEAEQGTLAVPDLELEIPLKIGHLDPVEEDSGWRARLSNLGYTAGQTGKPEVDELRLHYALEMFQRDYQLKVTGNLDSATRNKLREVHGS